MYGASVTKFPDFFSVTAFQGPWRMELRTSGNTTSCLKRNPLIVIKFFQMMVLPMTLYFYLHVLLTTLFPYVYTLVPHGGLKHSRTFSRFEISRTFPGLEFFFSCGLFHDRMIKNSRSSPGLQFFILYSRAFPGFLDPCKP